MAAWRACRQAPDLVRSRGSRTLRGSAERRRAGPRQARPRQRRQWTASALVRFAEGSGAHEAAILMNRTPQPDVGLAVARGPAVDRQHVAGADAGAGPAAA